MAQDSDWFCRRCGHGDTYHICTDPVIALEFFDRDYPDWTEPDFPSDTPLFTAELFSGIISGCEPGRQ